MMYNQQVLKQLARKERSQTWLTLTDNVSPYTFLVNPENVQRKHTTEYSKLGVLGSSQPQYKFKYAETELTFPKVVFWTPGDAYDVLPLTEKLAQWVKMGTILSLSYGYLATQCVLKSFTCTDTQIRSGTPTKAEGALEVMVLNKAPESSIDLTVKQTKREQARS